MTIAAIDLHLLKLPLKVPYHLAFGDVAQFDTILVETQDADGRRGLGEATLLAAYGGETVADAWDFSRQTAAALVGRETADAKRALAEKLHDYPFSVTALTAAIEMLAGHALLAPKDALAVPLLGPINATDEEGIRTEVERLLDAGYGTLKVKVGFSIDDDLERVAFIQETVAGRALIRLDGNQGYTADEGRRFAAEVAPEGIELFEQPCPADDWDAAGAVAETARVPMMLDESIFGPDDIRRAGELGIAQFIKLKLLKMGGIDRLAEGLELISSLSMTPVLGNGVAADVACWQEACVAARHIANAGEFNGFLRPVESLLENPLTVSRGAIRIPAGYAPVLDRDRVKAATQAAEHLGPTTVALGPAAQ